ncbi:MAG TPA: hypothetical protein VFZ61_34630 [Polyangiales bacterium]
MLDRNALLRCLSALIGCVLALCWAACESTETGNPPVVKEAFLQRELVDEGLLVTGAAGAVLPGGSYIEITDLRTGTSATVRTEKDGSFQLLILGATGTAIKYTAWNGGGSTEVTIMPSVPATGPKEPDEEPTSEPMPSNTIDADSADSAVPTHTPDAAGAMAPQVDAGAAQPQADAGEPPVSDGGSDAAQTTPPEDAAAAQAADAALDIAWPFDGPHVHSVTRDQ